jgi:hypothetical protein
MAAGVREVHGAAEDVKQAAVLDDAAQRVAAGVEALGVLAAQSGRVLDAERAQVGRNARPHARNRPQGVGSNYRHQAIPLTEV